MSTCRYVGTPTRCETVSRLSVSRVCLASVIVGAIDDEWDLEQARAIAKADALSKVTVVVLSAVSFVVSLARSCLVFVVRSAHALIFVVWSLLQLPGLVCVVWYAVPHGLRRMVCGSSFLVSALWSAVPLAWWSVLRVVWSSWYGLSCPVWSAWSGVLIRAWSLITDLFESRYY